MDEGRKWDRCRWYTRNAKDFVAKHEESEALTVASKDGTQDSNKRRKLRDGKKMDVGSLLGSLQ